MQTDAQFSVVVSNTYHMTVFEIVSRAKFQICYEQKFKLQELFYILG